MSLDLLYKAGPLARAWAALYSAAGGDPLPRVIRGAPAGAEKYLGLLYRGAALPSLVAPVSCSGAVSGSRSLVLFSGGKDSTAAALRLRATSEVVLLFVAGINPAYPMEIESAKAVASALGCRLAIVRVRARRGAYTENPTKNQALLAIAADVAQLYGASTIAAGIMAADRASGLSFGCGYSDAIEMHSAAAEWMEQAVQGLRVVRASVQNDTDSLLEVADAGLLPLVGSCMATTRFRASLHQRNRAKYGIDLMPGRCGSCYKCASEYLHLALTGRVAINEGFARHCCDVLVRGAQTVTGRKPAGLAAALRVFIDPERVSLSRLLPRSGP